jgi:hypothetical protein
MISRNYADTARDRLDHACARMNELMLACNQYLQSKPICIEREMFDLDALPCVRFRYRVTSVPPQRLGLLAGEVIHQLRATLDNLVWALGQVYPSSNTKAKNDRLAFPVAGDEKTFEKVLTEPHYVGIRDFPLAAQSAIVEAQSFKRILDGPNLEVLHRLWNADKHKVPSVFLTHSGGISQDLDLRQPCFISVGEIADGGVFCEGALPPQGIGEGATPTLTSVALGFRDPLENTSYSFLPLLYGHIDLVSLTLRKLTPMLRN